MPNGVIGSQMSGSLPDPLRLILSQPGGFWFSAGVSVTLLPSLSTKIFQCRSRPSGS